MTVKVIVFGLSLATLGLGTILWLYLQRKTKDSNDKSGGNKKPPYSTLNASAAHEPESLSQVNSSLSPQCHGGDNVSESFQIAHEEDPVTNVGFIPETAVLGKAATDHSTSPISPEEDDGDNDKLGVESSEIAISEQELENCGHQEAHPEAESPTETFSNTTETVVETQLQSQPPLPDISVEMESTHDALQHSQPATEESEEFINTSFATVETSFNSSFETACMDSQGDIIEAEREPEEGDSLHDVTVIGGPNTTTDIHDVHPPHPDVHGDMPVEEDAENVPPTAPYPSALAESVRELASCNLSTLSSGNAEALQTCLKGFHQYRKEDEEAHKHWSQILQWILQATAFSHNLRLFVANHLTEDLMEELHGLVKQEHVQEKEIMTLLRVLVNILPQQLADPSADMVGVPFWTHLSESMSILSKREFRTFMTNGNSNGQVNGQTNGHHGHNSMEMQVAVLQLLSNVSAQSTELRYRTEVLELMSSHCPWLFSCALSWSQANNNNMPETGKATTDWMPKIRGLCLSCLLHVALPAPTDDPHSEDEEEKNVHAGARLLCAMKVPSNTFTLVNRELNSRRYPELQEKWLRLLVNVVEQCSRDAHLVLEEEDNLLNCILDSRLALKTTLFLLNMAGGTPEMQQLAERATSLLDASTPRKEMIEANSNANRSSSPSRP